MKRIIIAAFTILMLSSCSKGPLDLFFTHSICDTPKNISVKNALKRAQQISQIEWSPLGNVPNNVGYYYSGTTVKGLPYSSAKENDKFIGLEVSIKTFMTAVHNPRSVLYTEHLGNAPYHGTNCATYYGVVCSSAVDYALGLSVNYVTSMIDTLSCFDRVAIQSPSEIELCDVLWSPGHVVMVSNIERHASDSSIAKVSILESSGTSTRIHSYSYSGFKERWEDVGWVLYRYNGFDVKIPYEPNPFVPIEGELTSPFKYNDIICTSRGEDVVYREGESVVLNVLNATYANLSLYRDNELVEKRRIRSLDEEFKDLPCGNYSVIATDDKGNSSDKVLFTVVDTDVEIERNGEDLRVTFNSEIGSPFYVKLCNEAGGPYYLRLLSEEEIKGGCAIIPLVDKNVKNIFCKVFFTTPYGIVTNKPMRIDSL